MVEKEVRFVLSATDRASPVVEAAARKFQRATADFNRRAGMSAVDADAGAFSAWRDSERRRAADSVRSEVQRMRAAALTQLSDIEALANGATESPAEKTGGGVRGALLAAQ